MSPDDDAAREISRLREQGETHTKGMMEDATAVKEIQAELRTIFRRLDDLDAENKALRAFVVHDESWHRITGNEPDVEVVRISWAAFREKWKAGWRPTV